MSDERANQKVCFVIMPYSVREPNPGGYDENHWRDVYDGLIAPAIVKAGLKSHRDDDDYATRPVTEGIWKKIESADIVLCDVSSHNPNVHLELGWAMRSGQRIVLIRDEKTSVNFNLNQLLPRSYLSTLQPTALKRSIGEIALAIEATLAADVTLHSAIGKLRLREQATEAARDSIEVSLLQQVLAEIQGLKGQSTAIPNQVVDTNVGLDIGNPRNLEIALVGSTWRKAGGLEDVFFNANGVLIYHSVGFTQTVQNKYTIAPDGRSIDLIWKHDGYVAHCRFDTRYSHFTEQDGTVWWLVARRPYRHPSFGP